MGLLSEFRNLGFLSPGILSLGILSVGILSAGFLSCGVFVGNPIYIHVIYRFVILVNVTSVMTYIYWYRLAP